jgi:hypothetical protein
MAHATKGKRAFNFVPVEILVVMIKFLSGYGDSKLVQEKTMRVLCGKAKRRIYNLKHVLFCSPADSRAARLGIFSKIKQSAEENGIYQDNCIAMCTDET